MNKPTDSQTYDHTYDALHYTVNYVKDKPKHLTTPNFGKVEPLYFGVDFGLKAK